MSIVPIVFISHPTWAFTGGAAAPYRATPCSAPSHLLMGGTASDACPPMSTYTRVTTARSPPAS